MTTRINTSREAIKNRMLKHALNYWNIKNTEDLDPAIKLMMEALSLELCNLGNEMKDTQVRMLEKVSNLMAPDSLTSPNPAHSLMHAAPVEARELLDKTCSFYTQQKIALRPNEEPDTMLDIHFTPVDTVDLLNVKAKILVSSGNMYSMGAGSSKQLIARSNSRLMENNSLWVGLKIDASINSFENMRFCFDWKNLELTLSTQLVQLLPLSKWRFKNQDIETVTDIRYIAGKSGQQKAADLFSDYDLLSLKENDIKQYYNQRFITITDNRELINANDAEKYPPDFEDLFEITALQSLTEKLVWIKIIFPPAVHDAYLDELFVYPNVFPVINRKLTDLKYRLKGGSTIIPLRTGNFDQFLSVEALVDETRPYFSVPYRKNDEEDNGTYTLRNGGAERFDNRNAREQISYLMELLRSESAAFAAYGYDFIATTLKELNQKISLMEQKTRGFMNQSSEIPNYIIVKPFEGRELMYVQFWTTLAETANNVRAGTRLIQSKGTRIQQDSLQLVTASIGGKNRLKPEETLNAFRYGLLTRNRILTVQDIRNFCFYELSGKIRDVSVSRGYEMLQGQKESFRRTIDIILTPVMENPFTSDEWALIGDQLKSRLHQRSGIMSNYRVLVQQSESVRAGRLN